MGRIVIRDAAGNVIIRIDGQGVERRAEGATAQEAIDGVERRLEGADLRGMDLAGADLSGADLAGASLGHANLADANLSGANLMGARIDSANLAGACLSGTNLSGATVFAAAQAPCRFRHVDLNGVRLVDTDGEPLSRDRRPGGIRRDWTLGAWRAQIDQLARCCPSEDEAHLLHHAYRLVMRPSGPRRQKRRLTLHGDVVTIRIARQERPGWMGPVAAHEIVVTRKRDKATLRMCSYDYGPLFAGRLGEGSLEDCSLTYGGFHPQRDMTDVILAAADLMLRGLRWPCMWPTPLPLGHLEPVHVPPVRWGAPERSGSQGGGAAAA